MAETILVVEDEPAIRELIGFACESSGYAVLRAGSVKEASDLLSQNRVHLILLDWMLPDLSGLQWLDKLKHDERYAAVPVIMLTARGTESDKVAGLDAGADDYLVKPFSPREVVSRIKAVLRRTCAAPDTAQEEKLTTLTFGSLEIQPERYSVKLAGQSIACTPREVELLYLLASHPGRVFDREQILSRIWGYDFFGDTRTVDTHIKRLRQKLSCDEMGQKWDIITVYGVGYKFEAEA